MEVTVNMVKELREQCGAGIMECRNVLREVGGDMAKALQVLKEKGVMKAEKKASRATTEGLVEAYIHTGGRIGSLVEVNCETDFVARTDEFKALAHDLAMQVAALSPQFITAEEIPAGAEVDPKIACLLLQPYIKDPTKTIKDVIMETIARLGENIRVKRFARFELGT